MAKKKTADISPTAATPETKAAAPRRRATSKKTTVETVVETSNDKQISNQGNGADSTPPSVSAPDASANSRPTYEQIAQAAYLRYLSRGGSDGADFDDWVAAEQELKTR